MPIFAPSSGGSFDSLTGSPGDNTALAAALAAKLDATGGTITPASNTTALTLGGSLTGSNAQPALSLSPTWNTTGAPALIYGRVTNTASGANAKLIDLGTVADGSLFSVDKDGSVNTNVVKSAGAIDLRIGGTNKFGCGGSYNFCFQPLVMADTYLRFSAMTPPGAADANSANVYTDISGGKVRLMVIFPSGAAQVLATQP